MMLLGMVTTACGARPATDDGEPTGAPPLPETRRQDVVDTLHGVQVADPYRWLEDVEAAEVQAWMDAQHAHTRATLDALPGRKALQERFESLAYIDSISAPRKRGDRQFYVRRHADKEKAIVYWREGAAGDERVLLDPNAMSTAERDVSLGTWVPSWDGQKLAYALRENNADEATLYVMDIASGENSAIDVIEGAKYARPNWTPDNAGFYYTWLPVDPKIPVDQRPGHAEVRFHALGTDPQTDRVVHPALGDPTRFISASLSRDGRWLFLYKWHGWTSATLEFKDLSAGPEAPFKPFFTSDDSQAYVIPWADHFTIVTNEGAPRWRIYRTPVTQPERAHWVEIVPEMDKAVIEGAQIVGDHLVLVLLEDAASRLEVRTLTGEKVREIELPGIGSTGGMAGEPDDPDAYYAFSSFTVPTRIYRTDVGSGETTLWNQVEVPIDPDRFTVERVWYTSKDGTRVSMFLVHRKDIPRDGSTPFFLDGYGGFQVSNTPSFRSSIYPWLEAGGGYALAHLRGGGEYGEAWHKDGMLTRKQNVFDDFHAAAEYLIAEGYTTADKLTGHGRSNGGLLVGAAITQRPDLFGAIICGVPLLDMVRYHLFGSGRTWVSEYGSAEDATQFAALHAYSPYHHVKAGTAYPATLFLSADTDDRVDPLHARKMAAALQHAQGGDAPILLRIERDAGHGGADRVAARVAESVDVWAFLMHRFGLTPAPFTAR